VAEADIRRARRFRVGPHWIDLAEPEPDARHLHDFIANRGVAPYLLVLSANRDAATSLPVSEAHGARITVE
jgi:hypothetical protein